MRELVENIYQNIVPVNEGYDFLFAEDIYLPIYQTSLLVTKRTIIPISLVEEKVLQLLDAEVHQIDEIAKILGLSRRLLDVTIADLYSRDLVSASSNACRLLEGGKKALNDLNRTEKKQDVLKDIYLDGILGEVFDDMSNHVLIESVYNNESKMKTSIPLGDVKYYAKQFSKISEIFENESKIVYSEGMHPIKDELLKIDKVDNTFVKFIKIPIYVYVSSNGVDIDVVASKPLMSDLLSAYKDIIVEQINQKKILKSHFKYRNLADSYEGIEYKENPELLLVLKNLNFKRKKKSKDYETVVEQILTTRKLFFGEYKSIVKYITQFEDEIELYVNKLDDWAYDSSFVASFSEILNKKTLSIYYNGVHNYANSLKQLKKNYSGIRQCIQQEHEYFICWKIGEFKIYGKPTQRNVINDNTNGVVINYYLESEV